MTKRLADEQKAAAVKAVLDGGLTQLQVTRAAKDGQLDGVQPFTISVGYLCELCQREKKRRLIASGVQSRAGVLAADVLDAAEADMRRLKRKKKLTEKDHAQLRRLAMIARDLGAKPETARAAPTSNGRDSFLRSLAHEDDAPAAEPQPEQIRRVGGFAGSDPTPTPEPR
jgi:hypothetical protein